MVAIEDSLTGVTSALTAGLATVGVPNIVPLSPQPGLTIWSTLADKTIEDLAELLTMAPRIAGSSATLEVAAIGGEKKKKNSAQRISPLSRYLVLSFLVSCSPAA